MSYYHRCFKSVRQNKESVRLTANHLTLFYCTFFLNIFISVFEMYGVQLTKKPFFQIQLNQHFQLNHNPLRIYTYPQFLFRLLG